MLIKVGDLKHSLVILAGGQSVRMGELKPHTFVEESRLIDLVACKISSLFEEVLVVLKEGMDPIEPYYCVYDNFKDFSPLFGIHAGLTHANSFYSFIIACDMPFVRRELVSFLLEQADREGPDVVVPVIRGFYEPLFAVYSKNCIPFIESSISNGILKVTSFYNSVGIQEVPERLVLTCDPRLQSFVNLNTREDIKKAFLLGLHNNAEP
ncbi:MAG TPA: molybdenum cofactor guanylyltransferase [Candidatus Hydrothermia bacterium]|nr:molybdenum cofactor guanylyltransferase [Candidatus Hydrothermae bacterium]MDD3648562.1 molybdenum cofactor guanylyltransferase [Candidatus Hydrothermia bacterium]MDD5572696.1 molybdenum cofactor guanylyltransferase [Candidatus Hydrothermia bacterium]HOK22578.1 molybdenum cofactor guanylyltransferase [Candidatus Hydrothermia bacterium]HOL23285.1 molybdenum cofactor guanylyltransferase [Candidatus Hydrothermia bacterium]